MAALIGAVLLGGSGGGTVEPASRLGTRLGGEIAPAPAAAPAQWCGGAPVRADRTPDLVSGQQVHVVYAIPSDGADRFAARADQIAADLTAADAWWRRQDPTRAPRFDLHAFPGCATTFGRLDISSVRLPSSSSALAPLEPRLPRLAEDLAALGLAATAKKYLVYYDGPVQEQRVCGTAFRGPTGRGGPGSVAAVWIETCGGDLGSGNVHAAIAVHELTHQLGAVPPGAINPCPGDDGHVCDDQRDLMYPSLSAGLADLTLDTGRDDYYAHSGGWFDIQDSPFLARAGLAPQRLTVAVRQSGSGGRIRSVPAGINCPSTCSAVFDPGVAIRLVATPGRSQRFLGWGGACRGADTCTVVLDAAKTVEARFGPSAVRLSVSVAGKGQVRGGEGIACRARCSYTVVPGALLRFRAAPAPGWRFAGWSGACSGRGACAVRLTANRSVRATFRSTG